MQHGERNLKKNVTALALRRHEDGVGQLGENWDRSVMNHMLRKSVDLASNVLTWLAPKATEFDEIMRSNIYGHHGVRGHSRSPVPYTTSCH